MHLNGRLSLCPSCVSLASIVECGVVALVLLCCIIGHPVMQWNMSGFQGAEQSNMGGLNEEVWEIDVSRGLWDTDLR